MPQTKIPAELIEMATAVDTSGKPVSAGLVKVELDKKQAVLVAGNNITLTQNQDGTVTITASGSGIYTLPIASASTLGGIKVGANLSIDENGVLSSTGSGAGADVLEVQVFS